MTLCRSLFEQSNAAVYDDLREELRAFYPEECHGDCKDPRVVDGYRTLSAELDAMLDSDPAMPVFQAKKKYYQMLPTHFRPVLFKNLPFYFEAGINGGWASGSVGRSWFERRFNPRVAEKIPEGIRKAFSGRRSQRYLVCCGYFTDSIHHTPPLRTILRHGFGGVREAVLAATRRCRTPEERDWIEAALAGLDTIHLLQLRYADEAKRVLREEPLTALQRENMERIAATAAEVPWRAPRTFYEGLNTFWFIREILALTDGLAIYSIGHPDAMLKELYAADVAAGRLTPAGAFDLICRFLMTADCHHNGLIPVASYADHEMEIPLTLGGCDREGREVFNDLTRMFVLAHRKLDLVFPKLHCRCSAQSSPEYLRLLAEDIYAGRCVHTIFNDDTTIKTMVAEGKTLEDARTYICTGCWSAGAESQEKRCGSNYLSLARILEATIYRDQAAAEQADIVLTPLDDAATFAEVRAIMDKNIAGFVQNVIDVYSDYEAYNVLATPHPLYSACLDGCLDSLRDETVGGAKYSSRDMNIAFLGTLVDSLLAINEACFVRKACTVKEYLDVVRSNWTSRPELRELALAAPHWGDDSEASTALAREIQQMLWSILQSRKNGRGGPWILSSWIYREYKYWGEKTRATPDGRYDGDYLNQGLNPSIFRVKEDITTVLNAISRLDHLKFDSSIVNVVFDRKNVTMDILEAVFRSFCRLGMHVLQPNCFSHDELLDAQTHPEKHQHLIVKVCGFSARFVALSPPWQKAIIDRMVF